ncbi:BTB/POZ domain-containing protein [Aspergillus candidus]|uniref:BTB/POZ protein n=1 Tax=Aspergillus candidus TaxID=41067 RepID=A0A2I2F8G1_ASPCN|nr:BTB/POZ protein [Aspergillus candidus]PLB36901.1 BTB/POZ protein [Aspergillus candidus]
MSRANRTTITLDSKIHAGLNSIYQAGKLTDFTIHVEDKEFKVSKIILASQSMYFRHMFLGDWKEAQTTNVRLVDEDPTTISDMLQYLYSGIYKPTIPGTPPPPPAPTGITTVATTAATIPDTSSSSSIEWQKAAIAAHIAQYTAGDMFFIPPLQHAAELWFSVTLEKVCDNTLLLDVLQEVYTSLPGLRAVTARCMARHIEALLQDERFKKMMVDVENLAVDVCSAVLSNGAAMRMRMEWD